MHHDKSDEEALEVSFVYFFCIVATHLNGSALHAEHEAGWFAGQASAPTKLVIRPIFLPIFCHLPHLSRPKLEGRRESDRHRDPICKMSIRAERTGVRYGFHLRNFPPLAVLMAEDEVHTSPGTEYSKVVRR